MQNEIYSLTDKIWNVCVKKALSYMHSMGVRKRITRLHDYLQYGIKRGTPLSFSHLMALILYTDLSDLSTNFSSTFRKTKFSDSFNDVKARNAEYANWSRLLRECVEYWGSIGYETDKDKNWNELNDRVSGPFYCGMNFCLVVPAYNVRLRCPTSTSESVEIAQRFGEGDGIILVLNNTGTVSSHSVRILDLKWISNYANEGEYLFCGGRNSVKIESVIIQKNQTNHAEYIRPLYYLDCAVSGSKMKLKGKIHLKNKEMNLIQKLIQKDIHEPKYIVDSFEAFVWNKKHISLNMALLQKHFPQFLSLFFHQNKDAGFDIYIKSDILREQIFEIFPNVRDIEIVADGFSDAVSKKNHVTITFKPNVDMEQVDNDSTLAVIPEEFEEESKAVDEVYTPQENTRQYEDGDTAIRDAYKSWNHHDIYHWIMAIEYGYFSKYQALLKNALEREQLKGTDLEYVDHKIIKRWGIKSFHDKLKLYKAIKDLVDDEGV